VNQHERDELRTQYERMAFGGGGIWKGLWHLFLIVLACWLSIKLVTVMPLWVIVLIALLTVLFLLRRSA
jgi:hypothetical protein